jgi:uncharacterized protein (DUF2147 family)
LTNANSTYAPKANPTFTGAMTVSTLTASGNLTTSGEVTGGIMKVRPAINGNETDIVFLS